MKNDSAEFFKRLRQYCRKGWAIIPVPSGEKNPRRTNWNQLCIGEGELQRYFRNGDNVGILCGAPSRGLVDCDLDAKDAIELASKFLPETNRRHGRAGSRESHRWYMATPAPDPVKFTDVDGTCLAEIRSTGQHTLVPPSMHPSGERVFWEETGEPALVEGAKLRRCISRLAACALLARNWPATGSRHNASMALAGMLLRNGWPEERVANFVTLAAKCAGDEEWRERANDVATTACRIEKGGRTTGIPTVVDLLGADVVARLDEWLGLRNLGERNHRYSSVQRWPDSLQSDAFYGVAGDLVRTIEPHTEADPAALLVQFLTVFGNIVGRRAHFKAEADRHGMNLFVMIVGETSKGRKGSSWSHVRRIAEGVDHEWSGGRIQQGLSSGEGLIWAVRDPIYKREPIRKSGRVVSYQNVTADCGVQDKRLLVLEAEFASVLKILDREGNTLSATLRQAWDNGTLRILTKNSPAQATGSHISMVGHITGDELRRYLTATEKGNGFANRILWVCARRSKSLPEGGALDRSALQEIISRIARAVEFARSTDELRRSSKARNLWGEVYPGLSAGRPGLLGAVTSRAEAQVMRIASIYALLDSSDVIKEVHLRAALALWRYAEQSARCVFGDSLGDPVADQLLRALRKSTAGLTRTDIRDLFGRNRRAEEIETALTSLDHCGLARPQTTNDHGLGRPSEKWLAL
jgi:Protein of unknown function (DUF3987)/Bifunctional DNA primase/polymerase, N-terminal